MNLDSEVFLDDDEDQGKKERILTGVRWTGESVRTKNRRTYYTETGSAREEGRSRSVPPDEEELQSAGGDFCINSQSLPFGRFPFPDKENIEVRGPGEG